MPEESPFKTFADLPSSIDAFIDGLIGFVYKIVLTFLAVIFSPRWGALRARANPIRFAKPASALFVSIALVSISSFLGPGDIPKLLAQDKHEILSWMLCVVMTYFILDLAIYICGLISSQRRRIQSRTISILRYAVAGTVAGWFAVATMHLSAPYLKGTGPTRWVHFVSFLLSPVLLGLAGWLTFLPLMGGILVVGWSHCRPLWKTLVSVVAMGSVLGAFAFFVDVYNLRLMYALDRVLVTQNAESNSHPRAVPREIHRQGALVRPLVCRLDDTGEMQIMAAISNQSDEPLAIDLARLEVWIERANFNLINPDFLKVPIKASSPRILVLAPKNGQALNFQASLSHSELSNIKNQCTMEYKRDESNHGSDFESDSAQIEHASVRSSNR